MGDGTHPGFIRKGWLKVLSWVVVLSCLCLRTISAGWLFIFLGFAGYLLLGAAHLHFHYRALREGRDSDQAFLRVVILSHVALVLGFLFQYDAGDSDSWLVVMALLEMVTGSRIRLPFLLDAIGIGGANLLNIALFIPVFVSWSVLKKRYGSDLHAQA